MTSDTICYQNEKSRRMGWARHVIFMGEKCIQDFGRKT
jgi:hypothetical protein